MLEAYFWHFLVSSLLAIHFPFDARHNSQERRSLVEIRSSQDLVVSKGLASRESMLGGSLGAEQPRYSVNESELS